MVYYIWLSVILIIIWFYIRKAYSYFERNEINHLPPAPILGSMGKIIFQKEHAVLSMNRLYFAFLTDKFVGDYEFLTPLVMIRDPELLRKIYIKDFDIFMDRRPFLGEDDPVFSNSLFGLRGQKWRDMRSALSPAFTAAKLKGMIPFMQNCSKNVIEYLKLEASSRGEAYLKVDVKDLLTRYSNDVIATTAFGIQVNSIKETNNQFYKMGQKFTSFTFRDILKSFLLLAVPFISKIVKINIFSQEALDFFKHVILDTIKLREENNVHRPDMIQLLLEAKKGSLEHGHVNDKESNSFTDFPKQYIDKGAEKRAWSDQEIVAQGLIFFFAGFDTVSTALTFLLYELSLNLDVQSRLRKEIDDFCEQRNGEIDWNALNELKYLDMVLAETLRKWPPAPVMERQCQRRYNLGKPHERASNDFYLDKGSTVTVPIWSIHRDPSYYPDPQIFEPERFSEENKHNIKPFTYIPFSIGPRNCIGARFAIIEMKVLVFELLKHFEISPGPEVDIMSKLDPTSFSPKLAGPHYLIFLPRNIVQS